MKKFFALTLSLVFVGFSSANGIVGFQSYNISTEKAVEIKDRLSSMSENELAARKVFLENERDKLVSEKSSSQNPSTVKKLTEEIEEIDAENNYIAFLLGIAVVGAIGGSLESDNPDLTKPVITIAGSNPATVELGSTYTDAGASAIDDSGSVTVRSVGTVNTNLVGSYTITYFASDSSGNVASATRTVNVVDTTAPIFTSSATFSAQENQTSIGTVTASDLQAVTFSISGNEINITSAGVLTFTTAPDYETQTVYY